MLLKLKQAAFQLVAAIVPRLPAWLCYAAAAPVGAAAWSLTPDGRGAVAANLRHVLGPAARGGDLSILSRQVYENVVRYYVDLLRTSAVDVQRLNREKVCYPGYEHLLEAIAQGKGAIIVTIHFGALELALQAARARGLALFAITEPLEPPELSDLFIRIRSSHGHRFMPVGLAAAREALRTLRSGGIVLLVVDRDIQQTGVSVPLFGAPASMPSGAVDLARMTGAPLIPAVSRRIGRDRAEVRVERAVELVWTGDRNVDRRDNVVRLIQRFEPYIRRNPEQWLVLQRIWRP